ncbi:hypothetical protein NIES23_61350 (plasmid) [Trichormus variabilis NIES-23]|uniref:Bro-N domain-containing protein n=1 Tax=Trichormus variabilis NIES-23 TaxID=1973479 RepID=A0A1Z4KWJ2_ANAVA|nr:hypothetical protein NIES23_61350 [Trichormus variabilis NIES-23]
MGKLWQFWEFEHPSGKIVRVISTPSGLEIFAEDVLSIIAPELNTEKVVILNSNPRQRCVLIKNEVVTVNTLSSVAIYELIGTVDQVSVNRFTQWVRIKILPIFQKNLL